MFKAAAQGKPKMSKKPSKTSRRPAAKAAQKPARSAAAKRPRPRAAASAQERIAIALEAIAAGMASAAPGFANADSLASADAFIWHPDGRLAPVPKVSRVELDLLQGIDQQVDTLIENTRRFATGLPANNALLWGARGMGKSSLVKAVHAQVNRGLKGGQRIALIEIPREDIASLPHLLRRLRKLGRRFLLFCD